MGRGRDRGKKESGISRGRMMIMVMLAIRG